MEPLHLTFWTGFHDRAAAQELKAICGISYTANQSLQSNNSDPLAFSTEVIPCKSLHPGKAPETDLCAPQTLFTSILLLEKKKKKKV